MLGSPFLWLEFMDFDFEAVCLPVTAEAARPCLYLVQEGSGLYPWSGLYLARALLPKSDAVNFSTSLGLEVENASSGLLAANLITEHFQQHLRRRGNMLVEEFFSSICGPPLSSNTAIAKDVGINTHSLWPTFAAKSAFKKSSTPPNCLAANETHVFAAQHEKAYVHVYSRLRGNQEAFVALPERIRCLTLAGDVLILGTIEGRIMLWETSTGRMVSLPPCHVQAVSCVAATPYHLLTASDDSNVHVWSLAQLLELDSNEAREPVVSFSNHRGAITAIAASSGDGEETSVCVSASKDKTCIVWNYRTGAVLRTLLFPTSPLCIALDPCSKGVFVSTENRSIFSVEFFGPKPLLGPNGEEASTVVQVTSPFCVAPSESGPATCLGLTYDGTVLLSGHPKGQIHAWSITDKQASSGAKELTNLNAAVTNIILDPPLSRGSKPTKAWNIVKPSQVQRAYTITTQFEADLRSETRFHAMLKTPGFSDETLENSISTFLQPADENLADQVSRDLDEQLDIFTQQDSASKDTVSRLPFAKAP